jgi:hypothetical protein
MKFESSEDSVVAMCTECHVGDSNQASDTGPFRLPGLLPHRSPRAVLGVDCCVRVNLTHGVVFADGLEM